MQSQKRLLGVFDQFTARLAKAPRKLSFKQGQDFGKWQPQFKAKILELLGPWPESVPLNVQVLAEERVTELGDYGIPPFRQQHIVFDSEPYASVSAYLLIPDDLKPGERRPAILNAHGHGPGKSLLVGLAPKSFEPDSDRLSNEAAALFLVKEGYVVLAPDWRPFGERALDAKYCRQGRDACNVTAMSFEYFGYTLLALNIWDARRSIDLVRRGAYTGFVGFLASGMAVKLAYDRWVSTKITRFRGPPVFFFSALALTLVLLSLAAWVFLRARRHMREEDAQFARMRELRRRLELDP